VLAKCGGWLWQILGAIQAVCSCSLRGIVIPKNAKIAHKISRSCDLRPS